jgi:hypothetical protein
MILLLFAALTVGARNGSGRGYRRFGLHPRRFPSRTGKQDCSVGRSDHKSIKTSKIFSFACFIRFILSSN